MTVLVLKAELFLVRAFVPQDRVGQRLGRRSIVGMQQPLPRADVGFDLVIGIAEHPLPALGVHDRARFEIPVPDPLLGASECVPEPLLALPQRELGTSALRHIVDDQRDRHRRIAEDRRTDLNVACGAVKPDDRRVSLQSSLAPE